MGNAKKPPQEDQDNDGLPDNEQPQAKARPGKDLDGDGVPDEESRIQSGPIIINR